MEVALACHHRIAIDDDRIKFGFPEVGLGLLPGAGGVVRTVRLIGLQNSLQWLTQNRKYTPKQALEAGMIHELAADRDDLLAKAKAWIKANPEAKAPWDADPRFRIPGGDPTNPKIAQMLAIGPAMVRKESKGVYPAPPAIMAAAVEGAQVDFDTASRIESRYFAKLGASQISRNMINAFWTQLNQIKKGKSRPKDIPPQPTSKVGVLGSGLMGHGIAYVSALVGMDVVMTDANQEAADKGKEKIAAILAKQVQRGRMDQAKADGVLAKITATADYQQLVRLRFDYRSRVRKSRAESQGNQGRRSGNGPQRRVRLQYVDAADHRFGRSELSSGKVRRTPFLFAGGQNATGRNHCWPKDRRSIAGQGI